MSIFVTTNLAHSLKNSGSAIDTLLKKRQTPSTEMDVIQEIMEI